LTTSSTDEALIRSLEDQRWNAIVETDIATLERLISDDLVYTHSSGRMDNKTEYLELVNQLDYQAFRPTEVKVHFFRETAIVTGRTEIDLLVSGEVTTLKIRYTVIWNHGADDVWRFVCWHASPAEKN
jgi:ketosteroid isomerase-like protein